MTAAATAWAALRLVRVHAALTAGILALLGADLAGTTGDGAVAALVFLVAAAATAGGNALNDVHDRAIDAVNRPDRPIPSGAISPGAGRAIAVGAFAIAVAGSARLSTWCLALAVANVALLVLYARRSKTLGAAKTAVVGYLVGSAVLFGAVDPDRITLPVAILAACAALATAAREIVKDVEDMAGDRAAGARTLPVAIGARTSRRIADGAILLAVALALVPWIAGAMGLWFPAWIAAGAAVLAVAVATADPRRAQHLVMAGSLIEMAAFHFGAP
ncbi:MAG: UbiA family prenyltransferase [Alphaproteobacteria bacterium]